MLQQIFYVLGALASLAAIVAYGSKIITANTRMELQLSNIQGDITDLKQRVARIEANHAAVSPS